VFVTDDNKEDWWLEISGKTIGPRPELLAEVYAKTGLSAFYIYNSERFMTVASQHFDIEIEQDSIEQVKIITEEPRPVHIYRRAKELRGIYRSKCQVCGFDKSTEIAHIMPRQANGLTVLENLLLVCPNHHRLFDMGEFSISDDFHLIGMEGELNVDPRHRISMESLKFHRENIYRSGNRS
jgi:predicted restriction endonuclease